MRETFRTFLDHGVPFTIATDGPEMMRTHLRDEFELLLRIGALDEDEVPAANERGHEVSFVGQRGGLVCRGAAAYWRCRETSARQEEIRHSVNGVRRAWFVRSSNARTPDPR